VRASPSWTSTCTRERHRQHLQRRRQRVHALAAPGAQLPRAQGEGDLDLGWTTASRTTPTSPHSPRARARVGVRAPARALPGGRGPVPRRPVWAGCDCRSTGSRHATVAVIDGCCGARHPRWPPRSAAGYSRRFEDLGAHPHHHQPTGAGSRAPRRCVRDPRRGSPTKRACASVSLAEAQEALAHGSAATSGWDFEDESEPVRDRSTRPVRRAPARHRGHGGAGQPPEARRLRDYV
jgi:hypothetical protein